MKRRPPFGGERHRLVTARLESGTASLRRLDVASKDPSDIALSSDGSRVAFAEGSSVNVIRVGRGERPVRIPLPRLTNSPAFFFPSLENLRAYSLQPNLSEFHSGAPDRLVEVDVPAGRAVETGVVTYDFPGPRLRPRCDGTIFLALERRRTKITLRDPLTGREIVRLRTVEGELRSAAFLAGGRVLVVLLEREGSTLRLFSADGKILWTSKVDLPTGDVAIGAASDDRLLVSLNASSPGAEDYAKRWTVVVVDAATGKELSRAHGLRPLDPPHFWSAPCLSEFGEATSNRDRLFLDVAGGLVRLDAAAGAAEPVLPLCDPAPRK